jgi:type IV pilus assembly protein PilM
MAKIQAVWAIDIGQAALKALKLVPGEGETADLVVAEAFDYIEYPKILSQPDADPEELVREALTMFLGRNELKGSKVAIAVPGQSGLVKFIKLPPVEKKRIPDIVKFEAKQQIPFALEEVIWDYQQIGGDDDDGDDSGFTMAEVGLFAMKRDQINRAILPLKNAGIEVDIVQMGPIALYNYAAFDQPRPAEGEEKPAESGSIVLLDVGADNTDLIITDGTRIWQRNVPIGGNHFTRALTKELKLTFAKAEHLKRNATKAQDPRAVFTAMRGIFNDFASEISRSVGFYSSVNRTAKITKVVGLGNGFKLPGLQKFLQQNLNLSADVERLECYVNLVGDDVITAPQFQENLLSFAVAYGLGLQGLAMAPLRTNLLPPEIEQVRMIRRKKPWALAASALLFLGFSSMFISSWNAWAKVTSPAFKSAVGQAKSATDTGARLKSSFEEAKTNFTKKLDEGKQLVATTSETTNWPVLLKAFNAHLPQPAQERKLDPNDPANADVLRDLRVHIDEIKPVYRMDLKKDWYDTLDDLAKNRMHALDRTTEPTGEGWIVQVKGHHYNPSPIGKYAKRLSPQEKAIAKGPLKYIAEVIVPRLWSPQLRQMGIHHATLVGFQPEYEWVAGDARSGAAVTAQLLARAEPPAAPAAGGAGQPAADGGASSAPMIGGGGGGRQNMTNRLMVPGMQNMMGMPGTPGMMSMMSQGKAADAPEELKLTRTDFLIQFLWQPPAPDAAVKSVDEIYKELKDAQTKHKGSITVTESEEAEFAKATTAKAEKAVAEKQKAVDALINGAPPNGGTAAAPGTSPAPAGTSPAPAPTPPAGTAPAVPPTPEAPK